MTTVHYTKDTLAQRLLHLSYKTADLVDELRLDVISKTPSPKALDEILDLIFNLALDTISQVPCTCISSEPALDVVESDACKLFGDGSVLFSKLGADLFLDLGTDETGFLFGVARCVFDGAAEDA
ncbi:hypothetical protein HG531_011201 [Fusarium graminearum]|nr:hypothetical protein HG531_011201 [Fusarium graminearum]